MSQVLKYYYQISKEAGLGVCKQTQQPTPVLVERTFIFEEKPSLSQRIKRMLDEIKVLGSAFNIDLDYIVPMTEKEYVKFIQRE